MALSDGRRLLFLSDRPLLSATYADGEQYAPPSYAYYGTWPAIMERGEMMSSIDRTWPWLCILALFSASPAEGRQILNPEPAVSRVEQLPVLTGPYLGQKPPGVEAELFAPNVISTGLHDDGGPAFSPDGSEVFWRIYGKPHSIIAWMKQDKGKWLRPQIAPFSGKYKDGTVAFSTDGRKLFFTSRRPLDQEGEPKDGDIWYVERTESGWGTPAKLGATVNSPVDEMLAAVAQDGTIYFNRIMKPGGDPKDYQIFRARLKGGKYTELATLDIPAESPENLQILVAAPHDESYVILSIRGREDSHGGHDLYVSFPLDDDRWSDPQNLGEAVNSPSDDWLSSLSPDGKYLFFTSFRYDRAEYSKTRWTYDAWMRFNNGPQNRRGGDVYWVSTKVIEGLRP
jgi:hypothetical protein